MGNKLFQEMGMQMNPYAQLIAEINKFAKMLKGNPQQMIQKLLDTGEMTQGEYNRLSQMAQQIMPFVNAR